ncbi:MAG: PRC-barrel domain-containing protein [Shimia sp.]
MTLKTALRGTVALCAIAAMPAFAQQVTTDQTDEDATILLDGAETQTMDLGAGQVVVEQAEPQIDVAVTQPEVTVDQAAPEVTVEQAQPEIIVAVPEPTVTVEQQAPIITIEQAQPQVTVRIPEPVVTVTVPAPRVNVDNEQPEIQVSQPDPVIRFIRPEPRITVQEAEPRVNVRQAQAEPTVNVNRAEQAEVTVEQADANVTIEQSDQANVRVSEADPEVNITREGEAAVTVEQADAEVQIEQGEAQVNIAEGTAAEGQMVEGQMVDAEGETMATTQGTVAGQGELTTEERLNADVEMAETTDTMETDVRTLGTAETPQFAGFMVGDLIGRTVMGEEGATVGEVDYVIQDGGELAAVVGIGGFLGLGEYTVAVPLNELRMRDDVLVVSTMTERELENMPEIDESNLNELNHNMVLR